MRKRKEAGALADTIAASSSTIPVELMNDVMASMPGQSARKIEPKPKPEPILPVTLKRIKHDNPKPGSTDSSHGFMFAVMQTQNESRIPSIIEIRWTTHPEFARRVLPGSTFGFVYCDR